MFLILTAAEFLRGAEQVTRVHETPGRINQKTLPTVLILAAVPVAERGIAAQASLNAVSERGAALAPFRSCLVLVDPVHFPLIAESIYIRSVKVVVCGLISTG